MHDIPQDLDWVNVRSKCTLACVFEMLKHQVEKDIATQNALPDHRQFEIVHGGSNSFTVMRHDSTGIKGALFNLSEKIEVRTIKRELIFEAGITLNDAGRCLLEVDNQPRELWQVSRRALEKLFFESV